VPPGLARAAELFDTGEVNALIKEYAEVLAELVTKHGGTTIEVRAVTDRLGPAAFDPDGMHLSRAAYEALVPDRQSARHRVSVTGRPTD
jgi:class 3 adenylate cyclase